MPKTDLTKHRIHMSFCQFILQAQGIPMLMAAYNDDVDGLRHILDV